MYDIGRKDSKHFVYLDANLHLNLYTATDDESARPGEERDLIFEEIDSLPMAGRGGSQILTPIRDDDYASAYTFSIEPPTNVYIKERIIFKGRASDKIVDEYKDLDLDFSDYTNCVYFPFAIDLYRLLNDPNIPSRYYKYASPLKRDEIIIDRLGHVMPKQINYRAAVTTDDIRKTLSAVQSYVFRKACNKLEQIWQK
ncbi:MAG: hypothetical protein FWE50_02775 [Alphaproteobacteria bacterium]|nr:hypothetical protein [Alphaproteobacteria bacterium]